MDQYFGRMQSLTTNKELPARIRFLLQNTVELRENGWVPRKAHVDNGPKTINQIRQDAVKVSLLGLCRKLHDMKYLLNLLEMMLFLLVSPCRNHLFVAGFGCFYSTSN